MGAEIDQILDTWLSEIGPDGWGEDDPAVNAKLTERFAKIWATARDGDCAAWVTKPRSCLALLILLDQLPRRMFQGTQDAYATDARALAIAKRALVMGHDMRVSEEERQFFYLPLMHSESLMDQERCVGLMSTRMPNTCDKPLEHAKSYRDVIRQYGRFPLRNPVLGRSCTPNEAAYLAEQGLQVAV